jgi:hypothetical protein
MGGRLSPVRMLCSWLRLLDAAINRFYMRIGYYGKPSFYKLHNMAGNAGYLLGLFPDRKPADTAVIDEPD